MSPRSDVADKTGISIYTIYAAVLFLGLPGYFTLSQSGGEVDALARLEAAISDYAGTLDRLSRADEQQAANLAALSATLENLSAKQEALGSTQEALDSERESFNTTINTLNSELKGVHFELDAVRLALAANAAAKPEKDRVAQRPTGIARESGKLIVGSFERIWVEELRLALPARIDTGAETAALDARNITYFERDGEPWVRFEIPNPEGTEPLTLERRQVREALILQSSSDQPERRPVIMLGIQLGPIRQLAEFTLSDRSHLDFQMLVGRNILRDLMLVDVSATNLLEPPQEANDSMAEAKNQ